MQGPDFVGFFESRPERAEQVSKELGVTAFATLVELLDRVDAVTIVVPTPGHYAVAKQVLSRGIHAMIEKPLAATLEEADDMLALAQQHGAVLQTGHVEPHRSQHGLEGVVGAGIRGMEHPHDLLTAVAPDRLSR